jgi:hypothetical protein
MNLYNLSKKELIDLLIEYDKYIYNDNEWWNGDRQPVCLTEFYFNEYEEIRGVKQ